MHDADGDTQQRYELVIYRQSSGAILYQSGIVNQSTAQQLVHGLPEKVMFRAVVRVYDGYDWSAWSPPVYFQIITNRPPVASFTWSPQPVWEGDTVQLNNSSTDPDGDSLTYQWTIRWPDGSQTSATTKNLTRVFTQPGTMQITLTASDGELSNSISHAITVRPLTLAPSVWHTELWLDYHNEHGHETETNPKDFYAGELLNLQAVTSPTGVDQVEVWITATSVQGNTLRTEVSLSLSSPSQPTLFIGELYDERWISLKDGLAKGLATIRFRVTYANGTVKEADVPLTIIGNALSTTGVHRQR
jgi:PKD repeat protein